jgi:hypothetical protein
VAQLRDRHAGLAFLQQRNDLAFCVTREVIADRLAGPAHDRSGMLACGADNFKDQAAN